MSKLSRRAWLSGTPLGPYLAAGAQVPAGGGQAGGGLHRTQFDGNLLATSAGLPIPGNHGRQMLSVPDGSVITAMAWDGANPVLRVWRDRAILAEHRLPGGVSSPVLTAAEPALWISAGGLIARSRDWPSQPREVPGVRGELLDAAVSPEGRTVLAVAREGQFLLAAISGTGVEESVVDHGTGRASIDFDPAGDLHVAYEKHHAIEYRRYDFRRVFRNASPQDSGRAAEAFGNCPVVLAHGGRVLLAYRGESVSLGTASSGGQAFDRLGRGGYIAVLLAEEKGWKRVCLADSRQIAKPLYPPNGAWGRGFDRELLVRYEEFGPPMLSLGPDGVVQVLWCDLTRRWIYGSRLLGDEFGAPAEVRGPVEQLADGIAPRRVPEALSGIPLAMMSTTRVYLERVALPNPVVSNGRRIDFLQTDELAAMRGLEAKANQMRRHPLNPVITVDPPGGLADSAVVANIFRGGSGWRAEIMYMGDAKTNPNLWRSDGIAVSTDGIAWKKLPPQPLAGRYTVDGSGEHRLTIRFVEDSREKNPAWRYKGLWRAPRGYVPVVSADGLRWTQVETPPEAVVRADDDLRIHIDDHDVPERRFKANAISRSFCGRVAAQWTSADGVHWNDCRETLDFRDPFSAPADPGRTGRILLDSWSGPDDEDEIHGGYVFRDGSRWLLHYMKWTGDGHIYCALAASRDGLNYSRVAGGHATLPLGEAGTWDAGRVALREAPFLIDGVWRQYYVGCGWKHGLGGPGAKTFGLYSPCQQGLAEIPAGRWVQLQVAREAEEGELSTIPLRLARAHQLTLDVEGLGGGNTARCAVLDARTGRALPGFDFSNCDLPTNGRAVRVTWRGRGLNAAGARHIRLAVRLAGTRAKLFGIDLD